MAWRSIAIGLVSLCFSPLLMASDQSIFLRNEIGQYTIHVYQVDVTYSDGSTETAFSGDWTVSCTDESSDKVTNHLQLDDSKTAVAISSVEFEITPCSCGSGNLSTQTFTCSSSEGELPFVSGQEPKLEWTKSDNVVTLGYAYKNGGDVATCSNTMSSD